MSIQDKLFERAVALYKSGQKADAGRLFLEVIRLAPGNELAWLWYIGTLEDEHRRLAALQHFTKRFPENQRAKSALDEMTTRLGDYTASQISAAEGQLPVPGQAPVTIPKVKPAKPILSQPTKKPVREIRRGNGLACAERIILVGMILCAGAILMLLYSRAAALSQQIKELSIQNLVLSQQYEMLKGEHDALKQAYLELQEVHARLEADHIQLQNDYSGLVIEYNQLQQAHSSLNQEHQALIGEYNSLEQKYNTLDLEALKPPYIFIHDRTIEMTFRKSNQTLSYWSIPFASLESALDMGHRAREENKTLLFKTDEGDVFSVPDFSVYVSPYMFTDVIEPVYAEAESDEAFIRETWQIVTQLSNWTNEIGEIPRYPLETLLAGGGDCEDLSILFASMVAAAPTNWQVHLVYMDAYNPYDVQELNHVIVHVNTGEQEYLVETTSDEVMLPYGEGVNGWYIDIGR